MLTQLIINTLIIGSGYALVAMAFRLMYFVAPFFNLTLGASVALGAYLGYALMPHFGVAAYGLVLLFVILFTWGLEAFVYKPIRQMGASPMVLLVVSLGLYTVFESLIQLGFGPQYQTLGSSVDFGGIKFLSVIITDAQLAIISLGIITLIGVSTMLGKTFIGKEMRAINQSPELANLIGININKIIMLVSIMVGLILGAYGLCVGFDTGIEPTMGFNILFKGMIAAIIGGPSILAAYLGAMILALGENIGVWAFASQWRDFVAFIIFVILLWLKPNGIFGLKQKT